MRRSRGARVVASRGQELEVTNRGSGTLAASALARHCEATRVSHDALGRPVSTADSESVARIWTYNERSEMTGCTSNDGSYSYFYDSIGNRTSAGLGVRCIRLPRGGHVVGSRKSDVPNRGSGTLAASALARHCEATGVSLPRNAWELSLRSSVIRRFLLNGLSCILLSVALGCRPQERVELDHAHGCDLLVETSSSPLQYRDIRYVAKGTENLCKLVEHSVTNFKQKRFAYVMCPYYLKYRNRMIGVTGDGELDVSPTDPSKLHVRADHVLVIPDSVTCTQIVTEIRGILKEGQYPFLPRSKP